MSARRYLHKTSLAAARRLLPDLLPAEWGRIPEEVAVSSACGRLLAETVTALYSSPAYHASAMDGFAVRAELTFAARDTAPVDLALGREAFPVDTGDPLPSGSDAVIMVEDVHFREESIRVHRAVSPYENVRIMGEDVVSGEALLPAGKVLTPYDVGLCLAAGRVRVAVRRRPKVGIIPTGDELIPPGRAPARGEIVECNGALLAAMVRERGGEALVNAIVPDRVEEIAAAMRALLPQVDILVINAGSSAGRDDLTAGLIAELGELLAHGIAVVPGKPTVLGRIDGQPVIGLPGYPASAVVSCREFVLPLIDRFLGWEEPETSMDAAVSRDLPSRPGHAEFIRGQAGEVAGRMIFNPLPRGASLLSSFARANCVAEIPAEAEGVERGGMVRIRPLVAREELSRGLLLAGSHDLCLDTLREELLAAPGRLNLLVSTQGSLGGLVLLAEGFAHLATCHLLDPATGLYNRPYLERLLPGRRLRIIHVAEREQGLMVRRGNPLGIRGLADLVREEVLFVNRQRGSGTRILLDHLLAGEGIDPGAIRGYGREEITHLTVAVAVAGGVATCGLGVLSAAEALGLDFVPLAREPFDLVVPAEFFDQPALRRVAEVIASEGFKRRLESFGGYHTATTGTID